MYQAAFPHVSLWNERSYTSPEPAGSGMDFARAMFNISSKGSLINCGSVEKGKEIENGLIDENFLNPELSTTLSELCEFSEDSIAAPTCSVDPSKESSMQSHKTMISSSNASVEENILETVSMLGGTIEHSLDICIPSGHDETDFEWLSNFSEDTLIFGASNFGVDSFLLNSEDDFACGSISLGKATLQSGDQNRKDFEHVESGAASCETVVNCGMDSGSLPPTPVPGRARSKRPRSGARAAWSWASGISRWRFSPTSSLDSSSDVSYMSKGHVLCHTTDFCSLSTQSAETKVEADINPEASNHCSDGISNPKKDSKKHKWKKGQDSGSLPRRCAHCLSQKTPQWRLGPTGPKTLCNACGVRFKSGRLFPEYRPAKSPTYLSYRHSNSHKKVLEMRRRREVPKTIQQDDHELKLKFKLPRVGEAAYPTDTMNAQAKPISFESLEFSPEDLD